LIIERARTAAFSVAPDGAFLIGPVGDVRDLIRGWRGVCHEVQKSRVQLWRDIRAGRFPPPIELGRNSVAWFRVEIETWKASRPRRRYGSTSEADPTRPAYAPPETKGPGGPVTGSQNRKFTNSGNSRA